MKLKYIQVVQSHGPQLEGEFDVKFLELVEDVQVLIKHLQHPPLKSTMWPYHE